MTSVEPSVQIKRHPTGIAFELEALPIAKGAEALLLASVDLDKQLHVGGGPACLPRLPSCLAPK